MTETPVLAAFIALGLLTGGVYNFIRTLQMVFLAQRSKAWPWVYGKIIVSQLEIIARVRDTRFAATIGYEYEVDGCTYEGNQLNARPRIRGIAADYVRDYYPRGRRVKVYYNPDDPAQSLLEPGLTLYLRLQLLLGPTLIALGLWAGVRLLLLGG